MTTEREMSTEELCRALAVKFRAAAGPSVHGSSNWIATDVAALKQAASEKGYTLSDALAALMIGQLRGAEGALPGIGGTLGGTNNMGAAQVTKSLSQSKQGQLGWGAFAHKDTNPNGGAYVGWYWIAPSPLEAARYWLSNWWGAALLNANPSTAEDYATILYQGGYYQGSHPGDTNKDPTSEAGAANVADYAAAISRGTPSAGELAQSPDDPSTVTVDPTAFASLDRRGITEAMYDAGKNGSWSWLLPSTWDEMVSSNGVVWFGPDPSAPPDTPQFIKDVSLVGGILLLLGAGATAYVNRDQLVPLGKQAIAWADRTEHKTLSFAAKTAEKVSAPAVRLIKKVVT